MAERASGLVTLVTAFVVWLIGAAMVIAELVEWWAELGIKPVRPVGTWGPLVIPE